MHTIVLNHYWQSHAPLFFGAFFAMLFISLLMRIKLYMYSVEYSRK